MARILTRAGSPGDPLEQRFVHYHRLLDAANGKIQILPGGGVTLDNRQLFWSNWAFVNCIARASCFKEESIAALGSFEDLLSRLGTLFPASSSAKMNKGRKCF